MMGAMTSWGKNPPVQIFADTEAALARMRATAEAAGCRIVSATLIRGDGEPADTAVPGAALLIELADEPATDAVMALLDWVLREAEGGARRGVVSAPLALMDLVAAMTWHDEIVQLCEADEDERLAAVQSVGLRPAERVRDGARRQDRPVLHPHFDGAASPVSPQDARAEAAYIRLLIRARRLRTHYFRADLFADPAWDMLLDLLAAQLEGKKVAVSSLCIAAAVPPTTALRWIGVLAENQLIVRVADPDDGRRVHVELAPVTVRALRAWLQEARRMAAAAG
jgi:hypothetical protein